MTQTVEEDSHHYLGKHVIIRGVGPYYNGNEYMATVISIDKDKSKPIKVQYDVGNGFKRFTMNEFNEILIDSNHDQLEFGCRPYEWSDDQYDPTKPSIDQIDHLRIEMREAVCKRDFILAGKLKVELSAWTKHRDQLKFNETLMMAAINREDFNLAENYRVSIEGLKASGVKLPKDEEIGKEGEPVRSRSNDLSFFEILSKSAHRALGGGIAGSLAMVTQVCSLMWIRTAMNYQYRHGKSTSEAFKHLYADGGIRRFYRGLGPALIQGPMSRFGDVAANTGMITLLNSYDSTKDLPIGAKTFCASNTAAAWRIFLMPVDTVKTTMQVEGKEGIRLLMAKAKISGPLVFYHGGAGAYQATLAGHYPWFFTHNYQSSVIPVPSETLNKQGRNAFIGFCSSIISDCISNSLRVQKTYRQTSSVKVSYVEAANNVIAQDGVMGLFGRGLKTRILANGIQGIMFSVTWKYLEEKINGR